MRFYDFKNPKLLPIYFINKKAAQKAIKLNVGRQKRRFYEVLKGEKIANEKYPYRLICGTWQKSRKYDYPADRVTKKQQQDFRCLMRRRLRRMGLYTKIKHKKKYNDRPDTIKIIKNYQRIANNPNTKARAIKLDRKPDKYIYVIIKKKPPSHAHYLVCLDTIRINLKNGNYSLWNLNVLRHDIIRPYLLSELYAKIEKLPTFKEIVKCCREQGIKKISKRQKVIL